ncbi:MAG: nucleotide-binding protein [Candidatus Celaenobacter antarcticus]|nr:nucleotide-binding protein [Candidatus Celaenobacter antarcticus]
MKLKIFIGSSTEGLEYAKALQQNLDHTMQVVLWNQGVFGPGSVILEQIVEILKTVDFAALVVTPDDLIQYRNSTQAAPRDNVLIELGLCIGALGRERSFIVYDRSSDIKLPSDLAGITPATFEPHDDGNAQAALGAASTQIENTAIKIGERTKQGIVGIIDGNSQYRIIADLLGYVADNYLIQMLLSDSSIKRETGGFFKIPKYWYAIDFYGRISGCGQFSVNDLCEKLFEADIICQNLDFYVSLTTRGRDFSKWLIDNGYKAEAFMSPIGGWGELSEINIMGVKHFSKENKYYLEDD